MVRMMPAITAAARMMFAGILRVMDGAMYPPMKHPMHSMMAAGQSTAPWMMNTTEALMFAPVSDQGFQCIDLVEWADFWRHQARREQVPAPAPK